ncbi:HAD family hydrolase [Sediminicola arcticus]|jgi:Cof subfamily protein (haloacid dehalogenase superfamily)|uniref:HAD family hydrolase n=1 Tax=Sediminicola arcticus TaxID=1574308 RepID=A0ABV2SX50_9FLAO
MDLSKIRMVVTDMDGTLLNSKHEVSNRFFELFEELKKRDILFVAASGRQYNSIVQKLQPIKNEIIVIAENGGFAMQQDQELLSTPLEKRHIDIILKSLENTQGAHAVLCGKRNAYLNGDSKEFLSTLKEYYSEYTVMDDISTFEGEILKVAVYHFESSEKFIYPSVKHLEAHLKVKISGENWLDLSHQNAHKGFALEQLQQKHNISKSETLVFGDYNNDLEMLGLADYSFAMANAHPNVLEAANYKTKSNDENGVELILEELISQRKI